MSLKLMYITNNCEVAKIAENCGVDRIWVDLEWRGKEKRQEGLNTVKSNHTPEDISNLRRYLNKAQLLVRINPLFEDSKSEIDDVINRGADLVMLPMFRNAYEADSFVREVDRRAKVVLLVETKEAVEHITEIVKVPGVDEIHIGLNDLHLSYGMKFMFELLSNGVVEKLCNIIRKAEIPYGFGGIGKVGEGLIPAQFIIGEHYRLGSSMTILSRSFCNTWTDFNLNQIKAEFEVGVKNIRDYEISLQSKNNIFFKHNRDFIREQVAKIVYEI